MAVKLGNGNWAVKEDKLLAYNDNSGLFFNKEFDFSRGTSATYVAKDGLIKTAGIQPNIVNNGDFATDSDWTKGSGWSISGGKAVGSATGASLYQADGANYTSGKLYKVTFEVSDYVSGSVRPEVTNVAGSYVSSNGVFIQYITATSSSIGAELKGSTFTGSIDNVTVQEIQTDTPRIDFTNDTKGHLLLEPSRTNIITNSSNFSAASWTNVSATRTSVNIPLPDGTTGGFQITQNGGASDRIQDALSLSSNNHFFSLFVKGTSYASDFIFRIRSLRGEDAKFNINTNNEISYNSGTSTNYFIEEYENGWYRVGFESTMSNTQSNYFQIYPDTATDSFGSIYIWGSQVEEGSYATSYIPTTGAASTRNKDVCRDSGSAQDFNDSEGVLYAEIAALDEIGGASKQFCISNSDRSSVVLFSFLNADNKIKVNLKSEGSIVASFQRDISPSITSFFKIALQYQLNNVNLWVNGVKTNTDTSAAMPVGLEKFTFTRGDSGNNFNGKVRNVQVFTEALTDEQLEKLTS